VLTIGYGTPGYACTEQAAPKGGFIPISSIALCLLILLRLRILKQIHRFAAGFAFGLHRLQPLFSIRACFWAVLFVGQ